MKWILIFAFFSIARAEELGRLMRLKIGPTGKPAFGISYTYGADPDGTLYLLHATPNVPPAEAGRELRWNYYLRSEGKYLWNWKETGKVPLAMFQIRVDGPSETIEKMIRAQRYQGNGDLFLVLADDDDVPVYHLPISQFCAQFPQNFKDLSEGRACDASPLISRPTVR